MNTREYITTYSKLYPLLHPDIANDLIEQFTYIRHPTEEQLASQIELHNFWLIPLPAELSSIQ